jgi:uncharacterized protein
MLIRFRNKYFLFLFFLFLLLPLSGAAATPPVPAHPSGYVVDLADILSPGEEKQLTGLLRGLEKQTTAQMVILTVDSLDGADINSFSLQVAEQWQIGQKGKDNGLLFVIALQDRKYRFEVGYGLESILPDSLLGSLGRRVLVPYFKQGRYGQGIAAVTGEILRILGKHYGITITGVDELPASQGSRENSRLSSLIFFLFLLFFLLLLYSRYFNKRFGSQGRYGSGRHGTGPIIFPGGGWGGGSSGGFGGFSGGGGGFGGGGASGSW